MIKIFCDGASKGNPGPGGSGVVAFDTKNNIILNAQACYYEHITNNQAELNALLFAFKMAQQKWPQDYCIIYSDSAYCVNMCTTWIHSWANNGWINSKKKQVENYELVREIYKYISKPNANYEIQKIPGHSGIIGNELADALASNNQIKFDNLIVKHNIKYSLKEILSNIKDENWKF